MTVREPHRTGDHVRPLRIAFSGWYAGHSAGTGQYTDALLASLPDEGIDGDQFSIVTPRFRRGPIAKLYFEQLAFAKSSVGSDVAHVPYWAPPAHPSVPTVVTIHDLIPLLLPEYRRSWAVRTYVWLVARTARRASAIVADSQFTAADIAEHLMIAPERIHTIPLGVGAQYGAASEGRLVEGKGRTSAGAAAALRASSSTPGEAQSDRYALYLGGFDVRKNLATLLAAWRDVYRLTQVKLALAGRLPADDDELSPHPRELARRASLADEAYVLVGHVPEHEKPSLYRQADLFLYPSRYEGFGLPPLEAMACGTPVIASDTSSLPEVVGDAGILVAPDDARAWREAACAVLQEPDLAERLSQAGLQRASQFTWRLTARKTREVYRAVGAGPLPPQKPPVSPR